ncbi:MAG TPA: DUF4190 domain-containing protein [Acidimicrobiales bacterium]|nr:DUF4190 domain-containing protein [Acidimicrobiales bacterium]
MSDDDPTEPIPGWPDPPVPGSGAGPAAGAGPGPSWSPSTPPPAGPPTYPPPGVPSGGATPPAAPPPGAYGAPGAGYGPPGGGYAPPPGYGYAYQGGRPMASDHPDGTTVLVLGICSWVLCGLCAPFAWVMGNRVLKEIDRNPGIYTNRGNVQAGRILGMIYSIMVLAALAIVLVLVVVGLAAGSTS